MDAWVIGLIGGVATLAVLWGLSYFMKKNS
jgi:hypothetical protein